MMRGNLKFILIFFIFFLSTIVNAKPKEGLKVELQILDKITAKVNNISIAVNESAQFQSLIIEVYACFKNPPEEIPEDFVLLKIFDEIGFEDKKLTYQGWMISSSPSITPLEHPIYDLWIIDCNIEIDF